MILYISDQLESVMSKLKKWVCLFLHEQNILGASFSTENKLEFSVLLGTWSYEHCFHQTTFSWLFFMTELCSIILERVKLLKYWHVTAELVFGELAGAKRSYYGNRIYDKSVELCPSREQTETSPASIVVFFCGKYNSTLHVTFFFYLFRSYFIYVLLSTIWVEFKKHLCQKIY